MYTPFNDITNLNWKELVNFKNDFDSAWTYLTTLLDNATMANTIVYFGCKGYRTSEELEKRYDDYRDFYYQEVCGLSRGDY